MIMEAMTVEAAALLAVGVAGFGFAGWKDLRTTEFPDWIPYVMIALGLGIRGTSSLVSGSASLLWSSAVTGVLFLGFGLLLYHLRQWGDGDAWLLGAMGFLYGDGVGFSPTALPFPIVLLFTFFFAAFLYIVVYSVALGVWSGKGGQFTPLLRRALVRISSITAIFSALIALLALSSPGASPRLPLIISLPFVLFFLLTFLEYGRFVEQRLFRRRVPVSRLRMGDVPAGEKWRVLRAQEIAALKRRGGTILIKEGVRFAPVFLITILLLLVADNPWTLVQGFLR